VRADERQYRGFRGRYAAGREQVQVSRQRGGAVAIFYRGAAIGTYWHANDAQLDGFSAQRPSQPPSLDRLMNHIVYGTVTSPYVSLTRSYGIALNYALDFSRTPASASNPAFVYEIEIADPMPPGLSLLDPLRESWKAFRSRNPTTPTTTTVTIDTCWG
jgi:hypothetical protein